MARTLIALYDTPERVRDAISGLVEAGCPRDEIGLVAQQEEPDEPAAEEAPLSAPFGGTTGMGAVLGGITGLLVGFAALRLTGIGRVMAAGPIATALAAAGTGAVAGGMLGGLVQTGIPETDANAYAEGVRRGGTLLLVHCGDLEAESYAQVMEHYQPLDLEAHSALWAETGWSGFDPQLAGAGGRGIEAEARRLARTGQRGVRVYGEKPALRPATSDAAFRDAALDAGRSAAEERPAQPRRRPILQPGEKRPSQ